MYLTVHYMKYITPKHCLNAKNLASEKKLLQSLKSLPLKLND